MSLFVKQAIPEGQACGAFRGLINEAATEGTGGACVFLDGGGHMVAGQNSFTCRRYPDDALGIRHTGPGAYDVMKCGKCQTRAAVAADTLREDNKC